MALMGFSIVHDGCHLQGIWEYFNSYRGKNIYVYWNQLWAQMKQWSHDYHIPIDTSIY